MATPGPRTRTNNFDDSSKKVVFKSTSTPVTAYQYPTDYKTSEFELETNHVSTKTGYMSDVVVANFHARRAKGFIFNNPMERGSLEQVECPASIAAYLTQVNCAYDHRDWSKHYQTGIASQWAGEIAYGETVYGCPDPGFLDLPGDVPTSQYVQDIAVSQAWANIDQSEVLALGCAKEANQTAAGLISTARKVVKVFRAVKKFEVKKAKGLLFKDPRTRAKELKSIAAQTEDMYMEARYNLRPLYYDMLGIMKLTVDKPVNPRQTFRGYCLREVAATPVSSTYTYTGASRPPMGGGLTMRIDKTARREISARAGCLTNVYDPSLANRAGLNSLPATLYDLTPYSFIADWFFNVGDTMLAWVPKPGINVLASWVTIDVIDECINTVTLDSFDPGTGAPFPWAYGRSGFTYNCVMTPAYKIWRNRHSWRLPNPSRAIIPSFTVNMDPLKKLDLFIILKKMVSYRSK